MARSLYEITGDIKDINTMLVPLKPTDEMLDAGCGIDARGEAESDNLKRFPDLMPWSCAGQVLAIQYRAMLEAAK